MVATVVISLITFVLIFLSIIFLPSILIKGKHFSTYWIIASACAIILLAFSLVPFSTVIEDLSNNNEMNVIKIIVLFFSMTSLSIFLDYAGLFKYVASISVKIAGKSQFKLFFIIYFLVSILTVFTSNDIVILTFTPFLCYFAKHAKINPLPYLVSEFCAANTWSMIFIIGNPTNIYLASNAGISFAQYFKIMALPTIASGIVEIGILYLLFRKDLKAKIEISEEVYNVKHRIDVITGSILLGLCILFLVLSNYLVLPMWEISLTFFLLLVIYMFVISIKRKDSENFKYVFKHLPYELIPFIVSMFIVVKALDYQGISNYLFNLFEKGNLVFTYGFASFLASNLLNNIPMSILFSNILYAWNNGNVMPLFASIAGSNLGAILSPMGALAGIMFLGLLKKQNVHYSFLDFIKNGAIIALPTMTTVLLVMFFSSY